MKTPTIFSAGRHRCKRAFTLIEIMVATAIMIVLVGLVIQITSQVLNVWGRSSGRLTALANARVAMELITQDLETAVFRNNGLQWLRSENSQLSISKAGSTNTVALRLFSAARDRPDDAVGDVCGISYLLRFADPIDGNQSGSDQLFVLYRKIIDPQNTFDNLLGVGNQEDFSGWGIWSAEASDLMLSADDYLVSNIAAFEIQFFVEGDLSETIDTAVPGDTIFGGTDATVGSGASDLNYKKPLAYADIRLTVISDEGAEVLQNLSVLDKDLNDVILEYGQVFYRRVYLPLRPI